MIIMKNDTPITSDNRKKKEVIVKDWSEKVEKSKGLVFTNYQRLTHQQIEGIKKASKKQNAEYVITKNRLILRALDGKKLSDEEKTQFQNPTATLFMYDDVVEPLKNLAKAIKEFKLPEIKFGIIEGNIVSAANVIKLSTLPPLPQMRGQLLGMMQSPIQGLHRALQWNSQKLVMTLNAIKDKKSS